MGKKKDRSDARGARTLQVTGIGRASSRPDVAELRLGVSVRGQSAREARDIGAATAASVLAALADTGVADDDIRTSLLTLEPVYITTQPGQPPVLIGYQLSHAFTVRVRDVALAADALDAAVAGGATSIESVSYRVADESGLQRRARDAAVADARARASELVETLGVTVGRVRSISEDGARPAPRGMAAPMMAAADLPTPIRPGDVEASVAVTIVFDID